MTAAFAMAIAGLSALDITVAPDQPLPYVYMDEPLIVEFVASEAAEIRGAVVIAPPHGEAVRHPLEPMDLRAHDVRWFPVELSRQPLSGPHTARFALEVNGEPLNVERAFNRIDRPGPRMPSPFLVNLDRIDEGMLLSLKAIPIGEVRLELEADGGALAGKATQAQLELTPVIRDAGQAEALLKDVPHRVPPSIARWELAAEPRTMSPAAPQALRDVAEAPVYAHVDDVDALAAVLRGRPIDGLAVDTGAWDPSTYRAIVRGHRELGYEGVPRYAAGRGLPTGTATPAGGDIVRFAIQQIAWGFTHTSVDGDLIYSAGQFGPAFGYLGGLAHRLADRDYFGPLSTDAPARIEVFRRGDMWTAAVWATVEDQGAEVLVDLPVAADGAATHYDALGNVLAPLEVRDGVVQVAAAAEPAFVESRGGPMLQRVAAEAARRRADAFVGDERFAEALPEAVLQLVAPYAEGTMEDGEGRERFLGLLRLFVYLERERAEGALPVDAAIPAAGALADLARYLCVLEEARGEPFVELLPKTLANCRDFQLQYVATAGEANESPLDRGAWLIGEVRRLCDQAVRLDEMGRSIEAAAVARLAEWRARSLEYAAPID